MKNSPLRKEWCVSLFILGMAVKVAKEHYDAGKDQITLIGSNADVVNFMRDWMRVILNLQ